MKGRLQGLRVAVVEDEYFIAVEVMEALLAEGAIIVGPAANLDRAMDLADEPIDAAILDINLQGEMVYPLARRLRQQNLPFVFATGYETTAIDAEFRDVAQWQKPFEMDWLIKELFPGGTH